MPLGLQKLSVEEKEVRLRGVFDEKIMKNCASNNYKSIKFIEAAVMRRQFITGQL